MKESESWLVSQASTYPTNKRVEIALQYIHGVGPQTAKEILDEGRDRAEARRVNQSDRRRSPADP